MNANVTSTHPVNQISVEPVQKQVNKCEQRIIPEYICVVKITSSMTYNHISLSQKEADKRKMIQNGSDINAQEKL